MSIDDSRFLIALSLIHPDPVSLLAAWAGDVNRLSPEIYAAYLARSPALATLPKDAEFSRRLQRRSRAGRANRRWRWSRWIPARPTPRRPSWSRLTSASPNLDFFQHPFQNQSRSLSLLGSLIAREEQARGL